jgi:hypothetical protein
MVNPNELIISGFWFLHERGMVGYEGEGRWVVLTRDWFGIRGK